MKIKKIHRRINLIGFLLLLSIPLTSCGLTVSEEQRYKYINEVATQLDYQEAGGTIIEEKYDDNDRVFGTANLNIKIEGTIESYNFVKEKALQIDQAVCPGPDTNPRFLSCQINGITVRIAYRDVGSPKYVNVSISDSMGGRG